MYKMDAAQQIKKFKEFLESNYHAELLEIIRKGGRSLVIDFSALSIFDPELAELLLEQPEEVIKAADISVTEFDLPQHVKNFRIRFTNLPQSQRIMIRNVRSAHINKLIAIEGIIRQASDVRPQVMAARFECPSCGNTITVLQLDSKFKEPMRCSCGRKGKFKLVGKELVDAQRLVVEESPESLEGGEQPKRLSVFLKEDLVEPKMEKKTTPGSRVRVTGTIKEVPVILKTGIQSTRFDLVVEANSIESIEEMYTTIEVTKEEEVKIKELAKDPKVYEKFIGSIAPGVYGHDDIKGALVLQLMGGVKKKSKDGVEKRGDMHVLLVGDPGAAKSTFLVYMSKTAPKARYVAGKSATGAGLTAAVVKDEFLRGWALEAGAMVLANGGLCAIDELDKMSPDDRDALHEALAQQRISISKANIQATLKAETTVLAAANPKFGRFDPYVPIAEQINLPPTLINRFDLIFPVRDLPNKEMDEKIASHVLELHQNIESKQPVIDIPFLKKYVAYVKQNVFPKLTESAMDEIKSFYVGLRSMGASDEGAVKPIPISARQLEALVRLAEGSARLRLSTTVSRADAKRAIEILKHCLMQVGFDYETGRIDIDRISTGITATERSKIVNVREIIMELENRVGKTIPIEDVMREAAERKISEEGVEEAIEKLKRSGDIFEPKRGYLSRI